MIYPDKYIDEVWNWIMAFIAANPKSYTLFILPFAALLMKKFPWLKKAWDWAKEKMPWLNRAA